jgi:REP element-mobilizing transposase RayT
MSITTSTQIRGVCKLRKGRTSIPGQIYHIVTKTHLNRPTFENVFTGRIVVNCLRHEAQADRAQTLAFVVMPDHLHWLVQLDNVTNLSRVVHNVKSNSARQINATRKRFQAIWQRGFYDRAIRAEDDLPAIARYIVANPLRAGLAKSCSEYALWDTIWI